MTRQDNELIYGLFRRHDDFIGTSKMTILCLQAIINAIKELKCEPSEFGARYNELFEIITNSEPKVVPLIHLMDHFIDELTPALKSGDMKEIKKTAVKILNNRIGLIKSKVRSVIAQGLDFVEDGDVIIVHTVSFDIMQMLVSAKKKHNRNFRAVVLKQEDFVKTELLLDAFSKAGVEHIIIPEYGLGEYIKNTNKMFLGAFSVTKDLKAVCSAGTANIVSLCHTSAVPIYLFANTLKFAYGTLAEQNIYERNVDMIQEHSKYILKVYSHDFVDLRLISRLTTEEGVIDREGIEDYVRSFHGLSSIFRKQYCNLLR